MNDTLIDSRTMFNELERLAGKTITRSRKDKERMIGYMASRLNMTRRDAYAVARKELKSQVAGLVGGCLDRDPTLQKLMATVEDL